MESYLKVGMFFPSSFNSPRFSPFKEWEISNFTEFLKCSNVYNKNKCDREKSMLYTTLQNAIYAGRAIIVRLPAHLGPNSGSGFPEIEPIL